LFHPRGGPHCRYDTFLETLEYQNHTQSGIISIAFNHHKEKFGNIQTATFLTLGKITFGAVDLNRFRAPLTTLKMLEEEEGGYEGYHVHMGTVFSMDQNERKEQLGSPNTDYYALLDTGNSLLDVPMDVLRQLEKSLNRGYINYSEPWPQLYASCVYHGVRKLGGIQFNFGQSEIIVPWDALFYPPTNITRMVCKSKIGGSNTTHQYTLGLPFFQHAYVVHDLVSENNHKA